MNAVQEVSDFDTVVSENEHLNKKKAHCFHCNVPAVLAVEPMVFLVCSGEGQIIWRENLKASYSCIVSGVAGEQWKVLGEANTCNHCIGQANHLA